MHSSFLDAELSTLSAEYFRIVNFTDLAHKPALYSGPLATFLGMQPAMADELHEKMVKVFKGGKKHNKLMQNTHEDALQALFSDKRQLRWPTLSSGRFDMLMLSQEVPFGSGEARFGYKCSNLEWYHADWSKHA